MQTTHIKEFLANTKLIQKQRRCRGFKSHSTAFKRYFLRKEIDCLHSPRWRQIIDSF